MSTIINSQSENSEYLSAEQVANLYPMYTVSTLKTLRYRGKSPFPYYKIERKVFYKRSDIEQILGNSRVESYPH